MFFFSFSVLFGQMIYLIVDIGCEAISGQNKKEAENNREWLRRRIKK